MKKHIRLTAGIIGTVLAVTSFSMPLGIAETLSPPQISENTVNAIYEGETFAETLTPPTKTVYTEGEEIDFSDFEIGVIRMTQKIVDGEVKDSFQRIAYWVNWISPDCYTITDPEGNKYDGKDFSKLKADNYTVVIDSYMEFSETKDHEKILKLGGVDYSYDITIKKGEQVSTTTSTETVTTTTTETTTEKTTITSTTATVTESASEILYGDANCDNEISLADAVLIMQSISNPSRYGTDGISPEHITEKGIVNGDVYGNSDGITNMDALCIQKYMLGLETELNPHKRTSNN